MPFVYQKGTPAGRRPGLLLFVQEGTSYVSIFAGRYRPRSSALSTAFIYFVPTLPHTRTPARTYAYIPLNVLHSTTPVHACIYLTHTLPKQLFAVKVGVQTNWSTLSSEGTSATFGYEWVATRVAPRRPPRSLLRPAASRRRRRRPSAPGPPSAAGVCGGASGRMIPGRRRRTRVLRAATTPPRRLGRRRRWETSSRWPAGRRGGRVWPLPRAAGVRGLRGRGALPPLRVVAWRGAYRRGGRRWPSTLRGLR